MLRHVSKRAKCVVCGKSIGYPFVGQPYHSQACARLLLQRLLVAVPGVIDLLPPKWRADLTKTKGKRADKRARVPQWRLRELA